MLTSLKLGTSWGLAQTFTQPIDAVKNISFLGWTATVGIAFPGKWTNFLTTAALTNSQQYKFPSTDPDTTWLSLASMLLSILKSSALWPTYLQKKIKIRNHVDNRYKVTLYICNTIYYSAQIMDMAQIKLLLIVCTVKITTSEF